MSEYHNPEAFAARIDARRASPQPLEGPVVWWHVCAINHWKEVVDEQLRLLAFCGLNHVNACLLGTQTQAAYLLYQAYRRGVVLTLHRVSPDHGEWERAAIQAVWDFSQGNRDHAVMYLHSKGVTCPGDRQKMQWRRVMQLEVVARWRRNMEILQVCDMCGVCWQELADFPHFCGNFWMARCDWLARLPEPEQYRHRHPGKSWAGHSWTDRMWNETWLGSEGFHHIESFCTRNGCLWEGPQVHGFDSVVPGLDYDARDQFHPANDPIIPRLHNPC